MAENPHGRNCGWTTASGCIEIRLLASRSWPNLVISCAEHSVYTGLMKSPKLSVPLLQEPESRHVDFGDPHPENWVFRSIMRVVHFEMMDLDGWNTVHGYSTS